MTHQWFEMHPLYHVYVDEANEICAEVRAAQFMLSGCKYEIWQYDNRKFIGLGAAKMVAERAVLEAEFKGQAEQ